MTTRLWSVPRMQIYKALQAHLSLPHSGSCKNLEELQTHCKYQLHVEYAKNVRGRNCKQINIIFTQGVEATATHARLSTDYSTNWSHALLGPPFPLWKELWHSSTSAPCPVTRPRRKLLRTDKSSNPLGWNVLQMPIRSNWSIVSSKECVSLLIWGTHVYTRGWFMPMIGKKKPPQYRKVIGFQL